MDDEELRQYQARLYYLRAKLELDGRNSTNDAMQCVCLILDLQEADYDVDDVLLTKFAEANRAFGRAYEVMDELGPLLKQAIDRLEAR